MEFNLKVISSFVVLAMFAFIGFLVWGVPLIQFESGTFSIYHSFYLVATSSILGIWLLILIWCTSIPISAKITHELEKALNNDKDDNESALKIKPDEWLQSNTKLGNTTKPESKPKHIPDNVVSDFFDDSTFESGVDKTGKESD